MDPIFRYIIFYSMWCRWILREGREKRMNYTKKGPGDLDDGFEIDPRDWYCLKCDQDGENCECTEPDFVANEREPMDLDPDDGEACGQYWNP